MLEREDEEARLSGARQKSLASFFYFATEVCGDVGLDLSFHGPVCAALEAGESNVFPFSQEHYLARSVAALPIDGKLSSSIAIAAPSGRKRFSIELDGTFRGLYIALRGEGKLKAMLLPRGHIKTGLLEDFALWLQVRSIVQTGKPMRQAICCERQQLAKDILHGIRRKIEKNAVFQKTFPECVPDCFLRGSAARPKDLTWESTAIELPGSHLMHEREPSISCYGVATGITGCHFDRIFFDDPVTQKNIGTDIQIQKVRQFIEDALFLLDPNGKILDIGTRWHFADAHGAILDGSLIGIDAVSLCFATIDGEDTQPLFPFANRRGRKYGFTLDAIKKLTHGDIANNTQPISAERFSSQYRNQPIEAKDSLFPRDSWRFFDIDEHVRDCARRPYTRWGLCDPAIKKYPGQQTGDFAFMCIVDCLASGEWRVLDARHGRWTVDEFLDNMNQLNQKWSPIMMGVEEGQYENTLRYASDQKGLAIPIQAIRSPMNRESKAMRCMRITGKQKAGHIKLPGKPESSLKDQYWDLPDWCRTLIEEAARFPKGIYDDSIDTLGYGPDVIVPPLVDEPEKNERGAPRSAIDVLDWIEETGEKSVHPVLGGIR